MTQASVRAFWTDFYTEQRYMQRYDFEGKRIAQIDAFDEEIAHAENIAEKKSLERRNAMVGLTELFCEGEAIPPHQPSLPESDQPDGMELDNEEELSSAEPLVPTEQEKYMQREGLEHTRHTGVPRPTTGGKRLRTVEEEPVDISTYFDALDVPLERRIKICTAYASYCRSTVAQGTKAPRKKK